MSVSYKTMRDTIPLKPGVYFFKDSTGHILYVGKAANLRSRLSSYFLKSAALEVRKRRMLREADHITWRETHSEIEALLEEALLIKKLLPPYNIALRDDKQYLFVGFTKEQFPRIVFTHQPIGFTKTQRLPTSRHGEKRKAKNNDAPIKVEFSGPYTESGSVKKLLRSLRKTFPYCTCKQSHTKPCQQSELGLCFGFCCRKKYTPTQNELCAYQKNIRFIKNILSGRQKNLVSRLQAEMRFESKQHNFEMAAHLRDQLYALKRIFSNKQLLKKDYTSENQKGLHELRLLLKLPSYLRRIEGYDISNMQGDFAVGSMVVFTDGVSDKNAYRKFRIQTVRGANDPAMIHEILLRRLSHPEWPLPNIMLIDGGRAQLNAALHAISKTHLAPGAPKTRIISIAKREEELYTPERKEPFQLKEMPTALLYLLQQIRNEAHRFAISYYRRRHQKEMPL